MKEESAARVEADAHRFARYTGRFLTVGHDRRCIFLFIIVFEYRTKSNLWEWDWSFLFFGLFTLGGKVHYSDFLLINLSPFGRVGVLPLNLADATCVRGLIISRTPGRTYCYML